MSEEDRKLTQLRTLMGLSALINSSLEAGEIRKRAIEAATRLMEAEAGSLLLVDQETKELFFEVALGARGERVKEIRLRMGEGIAGWVAEKNQPLLIHDVQRDPRFFAGADQKSDFITRDMVCAPVRAKERTLGVLQAINKKEGKFVPDDLEIFRTLADQVASAIENANLYEELRETFYGTAMALAESLEKRDPYTAGHTRRVSRYSEAIGSRVGLSRQELETLKLSAILHDVGKIGVRDNVLLKHASLEAEELEAMGNHPQYGAEILRHVRQLKDVIPGVRSHHEKYDGTGYPDRLRGEEIPQNARIIAVADTFDAMTTDRPYRKALSFKTAIGELHSCSGTQFDPSFVEFFCQAYDEGEI